MSILDSDWRAQMTATGPAGSDVALGETANTGQDGGTLTDPATGRPVDTPSIERIR